jgi:type I restriction enzyme S subunit
MSSASIEEATEFVLDGTHGSPVRTETGIPVLSAQNVKDGALDYGTDRYTTAGEYEAFKKRLPLELGDVLLTIVGTIGRAAVLEDVRPLVFQRSVAVIRPRKDLLSPRFLYHVSQSETFQAQLARASNQSSQAGVYLGKLKKLRIPLPPLPEQRRIAEILDKADALRAKRRAALAQLDTLTQSIFLDMFGDPATNPKGFPVALMGDVCDVRDGTHDSPKYISDGGYPLVTSKNVTGGVVDLTGVNYISEADYVQINKRSKVDRGDIILPMIGTIGSPVLVDHEPCYAIKNVALIKFLRTSPSAVFVRHLLSGHYFDYIVSRKNRGGTQKFVSLGDLRAFPLPLPSREEQQDFARRVEAVEKARTINGTSEAKLNALFASLQHRAFRGVL